MKRERGGVSEAEGLVKHVFDVELSDAKRRQLFEHGRAHIDTAKVGAGRTTIGNNTLSGISSAQIGDGDRLAAMNRGATTSSVSLFVECDNFVIVGVNGTASSCDTVLGEPSTETTGDFVYSGRNGSWGGSRSGCLGGVGTGLGATLTGAALGEAAGEAEVVWVVVELGLSSAGAGASAAAGAGVAGAGVAAAGAAELLSSSQSSSKLAGLHSGARLAARVSVLSKGWQHFEKKVVLC